MSDEDYNYERISDLKADIKPLFVLVGQLLINKKVLLYSRYDYGKGHYPPEEVVIESVDYSGTLKCVTSSGTYRYEELSGIDKIL